MRIAAAAAQWVGRFYPGTQAQVQVGEVVLLGDVCADSLRRIWLTALLNERLHTENEQRRRALLSELTQ
jgi:hypothetical protein